MRKLFGILALLAATSGFVVMAPYIPSSPTAKVHVSRGEFNVIVGWADTAATIVRAEIRRRGILSDTTLGGAKRDTTWTARGFTGGGLTTFWDKGVKPGFTYRYQVRDSIGGVAFSGWSDSAQVLVPTRKF